MPRRVLDVDVLYKRLTAIAGHAAQLSSARHPDDPVRRRELENVSARREVLELAAEIRPHTSAGYDMLDRLIEQYPTIGWDTRRGYFLGELPAKLPPADAEAIANRLHLTPDNHTVASGRIWTGLVEGWKVSLRHPAHDIAC